jgi:hypothetical protein
MLSLQKQKPPRWFVARGQVRCNNLIVNRECTDVIETMRNGENSIGDDAAIC